MLLSKLKYVALRQDVEAPPTLLTAGEPSSSPTTDEMAPTMDQDSSAGRGSRGHAAYGGGAVGPGNVGGGLPVKPPS